MRHTDVVDLAWGWVESGLHRFFALTATPLAFQTHSGCYESEYSHLSAIR
jgi:hypothetical protein